MATNREAGADTVLPGPVGGHAQSSTAFGGGIRLPVFARGARQAEAL